MSESSCAVENCERGIEVPSRGLCRKHYQKWRTYGDPNAAMRDRDQPAKCTADGCTRKPRAKRLCAYHYKQTLRPASPSADRIAQRQAFFWANVDRCGPGECWPWLRKPTTSGYGQMRGYEGPISAHRFAYELLVGPTPEGMQIDHLCHDPALCKLTVSCPHRLCCNPAHLKPATGRDNRVRGDTSRPHNGSRR